MSDQKDASLDQVLDQQLYYHHYQPIFCMDANRPHGYECLLRTLHARNPHELFQKAILKKKLFELDLSSVVLAIDHINQNAQKFDADTKFYLNIYPSTLASPAFLIMLKEMIAASPFNADNFVLEINENEIVHHIEALRSAVERLQSIGVQIALDDIGEDLGHLDAMLKVNPDIIKLDKYFADDLANSSRKQRQLKLIQRFCRKKEIEIVLEGVETDDDLHAALHCGIPLIQGFLLGRPAELNHFLN